ncbi:MAG: hypothetical protein ACR2GR_09105 [Rhodothermales bacterium]
MPDDSRTYLSVFGFEYDPVTVTELIGLEPTETHAKGEARILADGERFL